MCLWWAYDESQILLQGGVEVGATNDAYLDAFVDVANFCFADHKIKII